MDIVENRAI